MKAALFPILITVVLVMTTAVGVSANGAICLLDSTDIEIKNNLTAVVKVNRSLEITGENGAAFAEVVVPVNDFIEIDDIRGRTILPGGREIKLRSSDIMTASTAETREFGGYRAVMFSLRSPVVGARLYYSYKLKIKSLLYLPRILRSGPYSIRHFVVRVRWQDKIDFRFDSSGLDILSGKRTAVFRADSLRQLPDEAYSCPDTLYLIPGAGEFKYRREKYPCRTWEDVGLFYSSRLALSNESLAGVRKLASRITSGAATRADSIRALFDFVADSVSYVALNLGRSDFDPHSCDLIMERRFGDCKDQSALLTYLCREAGIDAYPALVATSDIPDGKKRFPWPSFFDHVAVAVEDSGGEMILDPSEMRPFNKVPPPRLRDRFYLVADGETGLRRLPMGPRPSTEITWDVAIDRFSGSELTADFEIKYINDAAEMYRGLFSEKSAEELSAVMETMMRQGEWHVRSLDAAMPVALNDTLSVMGKMEITTEDMGQSEGLSLGSPILTYLLENVFAAARTSDFCRRGSILLKETVRVKLQDFIIEPGEYNDVWNRDHIEFSDGLSREDGRPVYRRVFEIDGEALSPEDFNSFRDLVLSMRNQRYLHMGKVR